MDIRQMRYFIAIAEEGQISKAAKKLHMAQPPLSQQLRQMEEELGVTLLERKRNGKRMELTEAGSILYAKSRRMLQLLEESVLEVQETGEGIRGSLKLGIVHSRAYNLGDKIKAFHSQHPLVSLKLIGADPYELGQHLHQRTVELAIVPLPFELERISFVPLGKEPFMLVVPSAWESFESRETITMKEIEPLPLLLPHRMKGEGIYERIIEECARFNYAPNIVCDCPDMSILLALVAAGLGASFLPHHAIPPFMNSGIRWLTILDTTLEQETALVWLQDRYLSKSARKFIALF